MASASIFAERPITPQMDIGYTDRPPRTPTVSEKNDQIRASAAIGAKVRDTNGVELGKIEDLVAGRKNGAVEFAILNLASGVLGNTGRTATAWAHLFFEAAPTPHFVTSLSREALAAGSSFEQQQKDRDDFFHIKADLLGKKAVGADGANLGEIEDLVVTLVSGRLVALVIDTRELFKPGMRHRAVAWDTANPVLAGGKEPVRLALSKADLETAPTIVTKAPAPVPIESGDTTPTIRQDSAGNISGSKVPAPAARRK
jgi:sporulation protein YlmC with PRC-barrel domain